MLEDLRSKAKDLSSAAANDRRQLSKARVIDIDDIPGTRSDQEGGVRGTGKVGKRVEVVTRSGRRAGRVVYGK